MAGVIIPKLHGAFTVTSSTDTLIVRGTTTGIDRTITINTTVPTYFIRGYTGETLGSGRVGAQLAEEIQQRVRDAAGTEFDAFTCTAGDTGFVTMTNTAEAFSIRVGTDTALVGTDTVAGILGYNLALPTAFTTSKLAANQHRYGWYPNIGPAEIMSHPNMQGSRSSDATVRRAPSGRVITTSYDEFIDNEFEWRWIQDEYMFPVGFGGTTVTNRDFESFWRDVIRIGQRFRFYPDREVQTAPGGGAAWEYVGAEKITQNGTTDARLERNDFSRFWRLTTAVHRYET